MSSGIEVAEQPSPVVSFTSTTPYGLSSTLPNPRSTPLSKSLSTPAPNESHGNPPFKRQLTRAQSIKDHFASGAAHFFGIPPSSSGTTGTAPSTLPPEQDKWTRRRMRHCSKQYGKVKETQMYAQSPAATPDTPFSTFPARPSFKTAPAKVDFRSHTSVDSTLSSTWGRSVSVSAEQVQRSRIHRRDSVARMAIEGLSTLVGRSRTRTSTNVRGPSQIEKIRRHSRSFTPGSIATDESVFEYVGTPALLPKPQYDTVPDDTATMETIKEGEPGEETAAAFSRGPSEAIELRDLSLRDTDDIDLGPPTLGPPTLGPPTPPVHRDGTVAKRPPFSKQKSVDVPILGVGQTPLYDDVFFDLAPTTFSNKGYVVQLADQVDGGGQSFYRYTPHAIDHTRHGLRRVELPIDSGEGSEIRRRVGPEPQDLRKISVEPSRPVVPHGLMSYRKKSAERGRRGERREETEPLNIKNVWTRVLTRALDNSDRRTFGRGIVGKWLGRTMKRSGDIPTDVKQQIDEYLDHRPYFTYWVTTVQLLVCIVSIILYGVGPIGFTRAKRVGTILHATLSHNQVAFFEKQNFWIGPAYNDLVHLGAKYSPCMRHDMNIYSVIERNRRVENTSACCIYNDKAGCFQATAQQCPICIESSENSTYEHMTCEITARPCCIGIQGECRITTEQYCDFVKGHFHPKAFLCSQVWCMEEVCGMIPFITKDYPNQFYRLFTSIFLHAGLFHFVFTCAVQLTFMRDMEKLIGWARIAIIYLISGIAGNLASANFVPYQAEVGPSGCQFGLLAGLFVDAIYSWKLMQKPWKAIAKLSAITIFLFLLGLLPWVDNWAHLFGLSFGLCLSLALFPYIQFDSEDRTRRIIIVLVSLSVATGLFIMLLLFFYVTPIWDCKACGYFNCIPFAQHFCDNQGVHLDLLPI